MSCFCVDAKRFLAFDAHNVIYSDQEKIISIHIAANAGEIAEVILLPGDPLRAKFIAENFLEDPKQYNEVRGMLGFTGTQRESGFPCKVRNGHSFHFDLRE